MMTQRDIRPMRLLLGAIFGLLVMTQVSAVMAATEGFLPNAGRLDNQVLYYGTSSLVDVFFTEDGVVFDLKDPESQAQLRAALADEENQLPLPLRRGQALHLSFAEANTGVELIADQENQARHSFFFGNDSSQWLSDQSSYQTLTYRNLWDGVDLVFTLDNGNLSYEIVGDEAAVQLVWAGADQALESSDGTKLVTDFGSILDDGRNISLTNRLDDDNLVFPTRGVGALLWSTMIGGNAADEGATLAMASNGDVIVAGETSSPDFPATPGAYEEIYGNYIDVFISRFSNEGSTLVWSTFIGTSNNDYVNAITLDGSDNPIIAGRSASSSYPTTTGAYDETYNGGTSDATVSKFSSDGSTLMWSTFVGGSDVESFFDLLPNASGELVCVGYTASTDYPVSAGAYQTTFAGPPYDYTVNIMSADGSSMIAGSYVGGSDRDACRGVAIDAAGDLFLSGFSFSSDFPVTAGVFQTVKSVVDDGALVKMSADLSTVHWSTFLGGNGSERALAVDLDSSGNPIIAGFTYSTDFPTTSGALQEDFNSSMESFVAEFNNSDGTLAWSTFMGGPHVDEIVSVVVDASDNPVVTGWTTSPSFPVNDLGFDNTHNGGEDIFVSRLASDGTSLLWGTYLGGSSSDRGMEVAMDADDNPIVTGRTSSPEFPVSSWAYDTTHNGDSDAIVARFDTGEANLSITAADAMIGCGSSTAVTFSYTPDQPHTPPLRGYSVRIQAPAGLTFETTDITVHSPLGGVNDTYQIIENATGDCTIDFSFLDNGAGLSAVADLFTINMTGTGESVAVVGIFSGIFRDEDNHPFDVDILETTTITVDCAAPVAPTLDAEPVFTAGTSNTLGWSDESASGALTYNVQTSTQADFSVIDQESGFIAGLSHEFTGLTSGSTYFYRVYARDVNLQSSDASDSESSTQDADAPVSSVDALPAALGATFDVAYTVSDAGSGVLNVELFYNYEGGAFSSVGVYTSSPVSFTGGDGDGLYGFYTVATDSLGNVEDVPGGADTSTTLDTTPPNVPTLAAEPLFTADLVNTVTSSDESASGAVAYNFQISQLPDFSVIDAEIGPVASLSHEFSGLSDAVLYYYRVVAIDNLDNASDFSVVVSSTQDAGAPVSTAGALDNQGSTTFDVPFTATDAGVGVETVELFFNHEGGAFASFGTFGTSPISFTTVLGEGTYGFYTVATDSFAHAEADPGVAQSSCVLDLTAPESSVDALAEFQTSGVFAVTASGSDNLLGIETFELFYSLDAGPWTSAGTTGDGSFTFTAPGDGAFGFYTVAVDSVGNEEVAPGTADATTTVDTNGPTGTFAVNEGLSATNDVNVTLDMVVSGALEMRFSNNNVDFPDGWVTYSTSVAWTLENTEGTRTVYGEFRDLANNQLLISDTIEFDLTPSGPVTFVELHRAHESVSLVWHNPEDSDLDQVEIWRGLRHDGAGASVYPDYVGVTEPTAVADRAEALASSEWALAGSIGGAAEAFIDTVADRGIYHYEIFAVDVAGNFSAPNGQMLAATNYILGDMAEPFDGDVAVVDLTTLGSTYGLNDGEVGFINDADVGPTHNFSGTGLPQPDDTIDFEDLMITSLNYDLPAKANDQVVAGADKGGEVVLTWLVTAENAYTLHLQTPTSGLKGLNIAAALPDGITATVTAGDLCYSQDDTVFLKNIPANGLDAGCALVGHGTVFNGEGPLLTVTLNDGADLDLLELGNIQLVLRGADNQDLEFSFDQASAVEIPTSFALGRNYPNPFNPMTTIRFSLPQQQDVYLEVFAVDGRRVAVLINESLDAGHHEVNWTGKDESGHQVASGVYFYRIRAGGFTDVQKMTLMK